MKQRMLLEARPLVVDKDLKIATEIKKHMKRIIEKVRSRLHEEKGAELVEMVITMPVIMLALSYIICFSQLFYCNQVAKTAADLGARVAIIQETSSSGRSAATQASSSYLSSMGMGIIFESDQLSCSSWTRGEICDYSVKVRIKTAMPMPVAGGFSSTQYVTGTSHMMIEKE